MTYIVSIIFLLCNVDLEGREEVAGMLPDSEKPWPPWPGIGCVATCNVRGAEEWHSQWAATA